MRLCTGNETGMVLSIINTTIIYNCYGYTVYYRYVANSLTVCRDSAAQFKVMCSCILVETFKKSYTIHIQVKNTFDA